jgi:biopolymer transport protein TolR
MSAGGGGPHVVAEINVTPLVDVMLVLLIIFMVTAPMLENSGVEVDLPREEATPLEAPDDAQLVLTIDRDRVYWIGESRFSEAEIGGKLAAIAKANPDQAVFLRADGDVPYRAVAHLMAVAKKAGMPRVGLVFDPSLEPAP